MQKQFVNKRNISNVIAGLFLLAIGSHSANAVNLKFDNVFYNKGEPVNLAYRADYVTSDGQSHTLQVWRQGQLHLRRKTDEALDTYVIRSKPQADGYQMIVVDYNKHVTTIINRNNLIYLGHFSDWFDMAHGLRHPKGSYQLNPIQAPQGVTKPLLSCQWYRLTQGSSMHDICWSQKEHLPMVIWDVQRHIATWKILSTSHQPIKREIFTLHDQGFVRNNANQDIESD